jgi:hypothetical protein
MSPGASFQEIEKVLNRLAESFCNLPAELKNPSHAEAQLRDDFLNPFFRVLEWPMKMPTAFYDSARVAVTHTHRKNFNVAAFRLPDAWRRLIRAAMMAAVGVCALLDGACAGAKSAGNKRPNVVFIVCDDLNHYVLHGRDSPRAKTPNIDRLAERGVTFANNHAVVIMMYGNGIQSRC